MFRDRISILVVSSQDADQLSVSAILRRSNWTLHTAGTIAETLRFLETDEVPVIVCERELPDGSWKDLLEAVADRERLPRVVVMSALAEDRLWSEVLNLGGYDLLLKPLDSSELFRVLGLAARSWHDRYRAARETLSLASATA